MTSQTSGSILCDRDLNSYGKGKVLFFSGKFAQLAFEEGLYAWGGEAYSHEQIGPLPTHDGKTEKVIWEYKCTPETERMIWLDESDERYKRLLLNSVRHTLGGNVLMQTKNLPDNVFSYAYRVAKSPHDRSGNGDLTIHFINYGPARLKPGQEMGDTEGDASPVDIKAKYISIARRLKSAPSVTLPIPHAMHFSKATTSSI